MKRMSLILAILFSLQACTPEGRVFEERQDLSPDVEWERSDQKTFKVPITNPEKQYAVSVDFRYANGYPYANVPLKMQVLTPKGQSGTTDVDLHVRDENGHYIGDPGYDIWDSNHLISGRFPFIDPGVYEFTFLHDGPEDALPFVMEIGLVVDEVVEE